MHANRNLCCCCSCFFVARSLEKKTRQQPILLNNLYIILCISLQKYSYKVETFNWHSFKLNIVSFISCFVFVFMFD